MDLVNYNNDKLSSSWWIHVGTNIQCSIFIFRVDNIRSFASASQQGSLLCAHAMIGILLSKKVNVQCSIVITSLIEKFARKFLNQKFMNIVKIIYPQHSLNFNAKNTFISHLA
jgi:hypothetical protein